MRGGRVAVLARAAAAAASLATVAAVASADDPVPKTPASPSGAIESGPASRPSVEPGVGRPLPIEEGWCAPGFDAVEPGACYAAGPGRPDGRRTLVVFLHGLVDVGSGWQHAMQRGMALGGRRLGFSVLAPAGRVGAGPERRSDQVGWPTSEAARVEVEDELVAQWAHARATVEKREGAPFDEVFVLGFSNGAYYAASLALRGRLDVDGYAVFAGGSAPKGTIGAARRVARRRPVFVAIAGRDTTAKGSRQLADALTQLNWPHDAWSRPIGHAVGDAQLDRALSFLRRRVDQSRASAAAGAGARR